jgi:hypothetical protein
MSLLASIWILFPLMVMSPLFFITMVALPQGERQLVGRFHRSILPGLS